MTRASMILPLFGTVQAHTAKGTPSSRPAAPQVDSWPRLRGTAAREPQLTRFGGDGGLILVDRLGRVGFAFNSARARMSRAWVAAGGTERLDRRWFATTRSGLPSPSRSPAATNIASPPVR